MSGTLNKVMLIGHLGDDVKIKHFDNGGCIARFPLATNETYTNKSTNEKVTNTDWHNIVLRNKAAEICEKYLSKGDKVYVEGKLRTRKWQGQDGQDRYTTEIVGSEMQMLDSRGSSPSGEFSGSNDQIKNNEFSNQSSSESSSGSQSLDAFDDDIPF